MTWTKTMRRRCVRALWRMPKSWPRGLGLCGVALALLFTGCHDADQYVLTSEASVTVPDLFSLAVVGDSTLTADGFSRTQIVATVRNVTEGPRPVLFTTTAGLLRVGDHAPNDSATVQTDASGVASVDLISSRTVATARVFAAILGVDPPLVAEASVRFLPVAPADVVRFVALPDTSVADLASPLSLTVTISDRLEGDDRLVTFQTSDGRFEFASGDGKSRTVRADADGEATVRLVPPDEASEVLVTATVKGFTEEAPIRFSTPPTLQFEEVPTSAPADGETTSRITVAVSSGSADREVDFETTAGVFTVTGSTTASVTADAEDEATVFLRSPTRVSVAVVSASVRGVREERSVSFEAAPPDSIVLIVEGDLFQIRPDQQVRLQARFLRAPGRGQVSEGLAVTFQAADTLGNDVDRVRFTNTTPTDDEGLSSTVFVPDSTAYRGLVTLSVRATDFPAAGRGTAVVRISD